MMKFRRSDLQNQREKFGSVISHTFIQKASKLSLVAKKRLADEMRNPPCLTVKMFNSPNISHLSTHPWLLHKIDGLLARLIFWSRQADCLLFLPSPVLNRISGNRPSSSRKPGVLHLRTQLSQVISRSADLITVECAALLS